MSEAAPTSRRVDRTRRDGLDRRLLDGPLITTSHGRRLAPKAVWELVQRTARQAGVEHWNRLSPHSLRQTAITLVFDAGATEKLGWQQSPAAHLARPRTGAEHPPPGPSRSEVAALLAAAETDSPRAHALISLLVHTGLRINEALSRDRYHWRREGARPTVRCADAGPLPRRLRPSRRDVAGRSVRAPSPPRRGRLLSAPGPSPTLSAAAGRKVLDARALTAWVHGSLAMTTGVEIAFGLGLTLLAPAHARDEVLLARQERADLIEVLLSRPSVVILERPNADQLDLIGDRFTRDGAFDPLATWVAALCRERRWPALSSDPGRLERVDPTIAIDRL